ALRFLELHGQLEAVREELQVAQDLDRTDARHAPSPSSRSRWYLTVKLSAPRRPKLLRPSLRTAAADLLASCAMVQRLDRSGRFDPEQADEDGLVAWGGSLEPGLLLRAYRSGV